MATPGSSFTPTPQGHDDNLGILKSPSFEEVKTKETGSLQDDYFYYGDIKCIIHSPYDSPGCVVESDALTFTEQQQDSPFSLSLSKWSSNFFNNITCTCYMLAVCVVE
ncbi:hypothetical protein TNCV_4063371 [Trichonephila clavipes]|nr:hypothetical protein TNCV_4063371 [Trichonephila clavipes]